MTLAETHFEIRLINGLSGDQIERLCETLQEKSILQHLSTAGFGQRENKYLIGAFSDETLIAVSAMAFAENRPWGSLIYLKIDQRVPTAFRLSVLRQIVDHSFELAEEKNCIRIYMANRLQRRGKFLNARLFPLVKNIERLQKYSFISESVVPANTKPQFEYEWQLMGVQTWPEELGIVSATLRKYEFTF